MQGETSGSFTCNALGMDEGKLMYVPITLNGAKMEKCMIDTGVEVNVISTSLALKTGLSYEPAFIKAIQGFNGATTPVVGIATCVMEMAPSLLKIEEKFLVVDTIFRGSIIAKTHAGRLWIDFGL